MWKLFYFSVLLFVVAENAENQMPCPKNIKKILIVDLANTRAILDIGCGLHAQLINNFATFHTITAVNYAITNVDEAV